MSLEELWRDEAACAGRQSIFYSSVYATQDTAISICKWCPVKPQCTAYALLNIDNDDKLVWGGMRREDRIRAKRMGNLDPDFKAKLENTLVMYVESKTTVRRKLLKEMTLGERLGAEFSRIQSAS